MDSAYIRRWALILLLSLCLSVLGVLCFVSAPVTHPKRMLVSSDDAGTIVLVYFIFVIIGTIGSCLLRCCKGSCPSEFTGKLKVLLKYFVINMLTLGILGILFLVCVCAFICSSGKGNKVETQPVSGEVMIIAVSTTSR